VLFSRFFLWSVFPFTNLSTNGTLLRARTAAETEDFKVDGAMMSYFFNVNYQNYYSYLGYLGVDTSASLKTQKCTFLSDGGTWFDYFMDIAKNNVDQVLAFSQAAHDSGMKLEDEDYESIDATMKSLEDSAKQAGYGVDQYVALSVGAGIKAKDVRNCLELSTLATKYVNDYVSKLEYTEEDLEAYYAEHKDEFEGVDYLVFSVASADFMEKDTDGKPVGDTTEANASAKAYADRLEAAASEEEFLNIIREYTTDVLKEEDAEKYAGSAHSIHVVKASMGDVAEWAFSANAGDTHTEAEDDGTEYTVYYLTAPSYRDETVTRNVRHILFSSDTYKDSTKVEEVYAELEAAGFSDEKFAEFVLKYSEDTGSIETEGKYEDVARGETTNEFNAWLFDESRVEGDTDIVESASFGWHIMQYLGEGTKESWMVGAKSSLIDSDYAAHLEEYAEKITYNEKVLNSINA